MKKISFKGFKERYILDPREVITILKNDFNEIKKNKAVLVIIIGLTLIPSLYAWFNIKAFWDPYSNTKNLKVAVVNLDKEVTYKNQRLLFGDRIIEKLKDNPVLDWQFVNKKKADEGLKSGKYFATLVIPQDFTNDILSVTRKNVKKANIDYTVNEKINAIAPKITDKGADTLKIKIDQAIIETISSISIGSLGGVSNALGNVDPKLENMKRSLKLLDTQLNNSKKLVGIGDKSLGDLNSSLSSAKNTTTNIRDTVSNTKRLNLDIQKALNDINTSFNNLTPTIKSDLLLVGSLLGQTSDLATSLQSGGSLVASDVQNILARIDSKLTHAINIINSIITVINRVNFANLSFFNNAISSLQKYVDSMNNVKKTISDISTSISNGATISSDTFDKLISLTNSLNRQTVDVLSNFDTNISEPLNKISKSGDVINNDIDKMLDKVDAIYPNINNFLSNISSMTTTLKSSNSTLNSTIDTLQSQTKGLIELIENIQQNENYKNFNDVIKSNIADRVDFLKNPVNIKENKIFKIKNYGSAMTPFYSVLASWVGGLILVAVLSPSPKGKHRAVDAYFGRLALFLTLSILQALVIALGDFLILGVTAKHPVLFTLILVFCSLTFTTIIYSLVSVFGTIGKGIAIFLLVIQIGGSGGTFPVEMTPMFFRRINSIIPFTYGISACREAIGGIYLPNLKRDIISLTIFLLIPLLFCIIFKEPINGLGHPVKKKFHDSFLIGEGD